MFDFPIDSIHWALAAAMCGNVLSSTRHNSQKETTTNFSDASSKDIHWKCWNTIIGNHHLDVTKASRQDLNFSTISLLLTLRFHVKKYTQLHRGKFKGWKILLDVQKFWYSPVFLRCLPCYNYFAISQVLNFKIFMATKQKKIERKLDAKILPWMIIWDY